jgi:hypothetical protein
VEVAICMEKQYVKTTMIHVIGMIIEDVILNIL